MTRKILFILLLALTGCLYSTSQAACMAARADEAGTDITISGSLIWASYPCEDGEDCPDCLTIALRTTDNFYYLTTDDTDLEQQMDDLLAATVLQDPPQVTVTGTLFTRRNSNYIEVTAFSVIGSQVAQLPSLCDEWNILSEWFPDGFLRYATHTERMTTDTIIGDKHYLKLEGREYRGALREGSDADIYFIPPHSTHEYLLYAFHAQVGDVFDNVWFGGSPSDFPNGCKTTVTAIEEVNGHKELKLDVEYKLPGMDEYIRYSGYSWIDRVGLHAGASGSDCPLECAGDFGTSVLCAYKDGEQIYISHEAELNGCNMQMEPYFPDEMRWTYLAYPLNMDTVFYNEIRVQGEITYDDIVYQNIGGFPVRAIGKQIVARIDEVGEVTLYNFGLNVGESLMTLVPYGDGSFRLAPEKVIAVDTITLLNGTQARRQTFDDGLIDIELVGASTGDFFRRIDLFMPVVEGSYRHLCCSVGDELLYEFSPDGCNYSPSAVAEVIHSADGIHPSSPAQKCIIDGHLFIRQGNHLYSPTGTEIE